MSVTSEVQVVPGVPAADDLTRPLGSRLTHVAGLRSIVGGLAVSLAAAWVLVLVTGSSVAIRNPVASIALDTATMVAVVSISVMSWVRYREDGPVRVLYKTAAFFVLFIGSAAWLALLIALPASTSLPILDWWWTLLWVLAGTLLLLATRSSTERVAHPRIPAWVLAVGPGLGSLAVGVVALVVAAVTAGETISGPLVLPDGLGDGVAPGFDPTELLRHGPAVVLLMAASIGYTRLYEASPGASRAWIAVALVFAASSQLFAALVPVGLTLAATTTDLLVAAFVVCAMSGVAAAAQSNLRSLRRAYVELGRAKDEEVRQAAFHERARLARDIHDNLVQTLWLARLRQGHVLSADLPPESRALAEEVSRALDDGLADARDAMIALDPGPGGPRPIDQVLRQGLGRLADRFGFEIRVLRSGAMPSLDPRVAGELLGILREAVANSAKHADATMVRIRISRGDRDLTVSIADNGNGFDPASADGGYGLQSIRRRADEIGAHLTIDSRPMDGTRVTLVLPLDPELVE